MSRSEETEKLEVEAARWLAEATGSAEQAMNMDADDYPNYASFVQAFNRLVGHSHSCAAISQAYSTLIIARKPV